MSIAELKATADKLTPNEQAFLHAYLGLKRRLNDPEFLAVITRRNREMQAGDYLTAEQVKELNRELDEKGL
jgi:hypothetical protein